MAFTTAAPLTALQQFFDGTVIKVVEYIRDDQGLTLDEAKDIVVNILVDLSINASVIGVVLKTKIALKTADYLGFSTKGFVRRTLSTKATTAAARIAGPWEKFKAYSLVSKILAVGAVLTGFSWIAMGFANVIEPGIYQPVQANNLWQSIIGVRPFPEKGFQLQPGNFDAARFNEFAASLEAAGIRGISNPVAQQSQLYSRDGLADVIEYVYGQAVLKGTVPSDYRATAKLVTPYLIGITSTPAFGTTSSTTSSSGGTTSVPQVAPVQIKVYTGPIAQGALGMPQEFIARPDDMINSADELKAAAKNNLAAFVQALPGRFQYEIGIVNSVKSKTGFTQKGEAVKVISGYYTNGKPRYKTIYHKFAVLKLIVTDENGRVVKLGTVNLGPVNVVDYQPTRVDLGSVQEALSTELFTTDINDITSIIAPNGVNVSATLPTNPNPPQQTTGSVAGTSTSGQGTGGAQFIASNVTFKIPAGGEIFIPLRPQGIAPQVWARSGNVVRFLPLQSLVPLFADGGANAFKDSNGNTVRVENIGQIWDEGIRRFEAVTGKKYYDLPQQNMADVEAAFGRGTNSTLPQQLQSFEGPNALNDFLAFLKALLPGGDINITATGLVLNDAARKATTLYGFYQALGKELPPIAERAITYEELGLGPRSTYSFTAEQNNRLLAALKGI